MSLMKELAVSDDCCALIKIASTLAKTLKISSLEAGLVPDRCSKRCQLASGLRTTETFCETQTNKRRDCPDKNSSVAHVYYVRILGFRVGPIDSDAVSGNDDVLVDVVVGVRSLGVSLVEFQSASVGFNFVAGEHAGQRPEQAFLRARSEGVPYFVHRGVQMETVADAFRLVSRNAKGR